MMNHTMEKPSKSERIFSHKLMKPKSMIHQNSQQTGSFEYLDHIENEIGNREQTPKDKTLTSKSSSCGSDEEVEKMMYRVICPTSSTSTSKILEEGQSETNNLEIEGFIADQIHNLVRRFSSRTDKVKQRIVQPPTPTISESSLAEGGKISDEPSAMNSKRKGSLSNVETGDTRSDATSYVEKISLCVGQTKHFKFLSTIDAQSRLYIAWLCLVTSCFVYNVFTIPLRWAFPYQTKDNVMIWFFFDYSADFVYLLDLLVFKPRLKYIQDGFLIDEYKLTRKRYIKSRMFRFDLASLLPFDVLGFHWGYKSLFRLARFLKIHSFWEFFNRTDSMLSSPHIIRIFRTMTYMVFLIHLNACSYYAISLYEGIGINSFVFAGKGNAYIRCFFFATKTATSIGKNPKPGNQLEYLFMICSWLLGVFVFALLIGQIRDIVATATRHQTEFTKLLDKLTQYMHRMSLPKNMQLRVKMWLTYNWNQQKTLIERDVLGWLPPKLQQDIAFNVHIHTLRKVQLFKDCDKALMNDLVLRLKPVLYLPGDYVCKKGEVGKEMYIVKMGELVVLGGPNEELELATLREGSVFGEISLLALSGGNRRTASVISRGFSDLYVMSKDDLNETIIDYPEAQEMLKQKAKKLIKENEDLEKSKMEPDIIIGETKRAVTPKLFDTVMQVLPSDSATTQKLLRSRTKSMKDEIWSKQSKVEQLVRRSLSARYPSYQPPTTKWNLQQNNENPERRLHLRNVFPQSTTNVSPERGSGEFKLGEKNGFNEAEDDGQKSSQNSGTFMNDEEQEKMSCFPRSPVNRNKVAPLMGNSPQNINPEERVSSINIHSVTQCAVTVHQDSSIIPSK